MADIQNAVVDVPGRVQARLKRRYAAERRFRLYGLVSVGVALAFLTLLMVTIFGSGYTAFAQAELRLDVALDAADIDPSGAFDEAALATADYGALAKKALYAQFPDVGDRSAKRALASLLSNGVDHELGLVVKANPALIGTTVTVWLPVAAVVDQVIKGKAPRTGAGAQLTERQVAYVDALRKSGDLALHFNWRLLTRGDSREPELAGIWGAMVGSMFSMLITLGLSFPLGVATAVYLEEFAPKTRWTDLIEVNINNLAAVPSIVFGLLGLAVFLNFFNMPRSAPLVGGLVLTLVSLPTMIIASRVALKAVPPSIREAALGMGASRLQVVLHHVVPLALPGMLTGTIISIARAVGETAPLLMIGMVAFIVDVPHTPFDPSTVLPVQVYLWAGSPERAFVERTSAAIIILLAFLTLMNATAIYLRKKFERRW